MFGHKLILLYCIFILYILLGSTFVFKIDILCRFPRMNIRFFFTCIKGVYTKSVFHVLLCLDFSLFLRFMIDCYCIMLSIFDNSNALVNITRRLMG